MAYLQVYVVFPPDVALARGVLEREGAMMPSILLSPVEFLLDFVYYNYCFNVRF